MTSTHASPDREQLILDYDQIRSTTRALCEPLEVEDMVVQTMPDVSPTKWHLAHVTWFFETMVLAKNSERYSLFDERFPALFNSYYQSLGKPFTRARRGLVSRPTVKQVNSYREYVDEEMTRFLRESPDEIFARAVPVVSVGLHHEQQHQELLLMDAKNVLAQSPLFPAYRPEQHQAPTPTKPNTVAPMEWHSLDGGQVAVGSDSRGFTFDNERPKHALLLEPFEIASRPVTVGEYRAFMADGGYQRPEFWLADGWDLAQREGWQAPLYWERDESGGNWRIMTLAGLRALDPNEPVCHVSYFEADAYASWAGCRLPTEFEWEHAADGHVIAGTFLESGAYHPRPLSSGSALPEQSPEQSLDQLFGDVWEWTRSPYAPYPGYEVFEGDLSEYNGKFMINQIVLRGGCCVTPKEHIRRTYRNFYYPHQRWMFAGFRIAR